MKIETIEYINSKGEWTNWFKDTITGKIIKAGTILDVPEERARVLLGDNPLGIKFALKPLIEEIKTEVLLEEMTREELIEYATSLGLKFPKNIKTINLINKLIEYDEREKQNS